MNPVVQWLADEEIESIYTSSYWNDEQGEQSKPWWIKNGNYQQLRTYLDSTRLMDEYIAAENIVLESGLTNINIADIAAGIGWTSALLSRLPCVNTVNAVEISRHRIDALFENAVAMFEGVPNKINRYLGSFYDLRFEDNSVDIVFLCQAFHHAENPFLLLQEASRVLKKNGLVMLIGEHYIDWKRLIVKFASSFLKSGRIATNFHELFPTDPILGDHYYRVSDYYFIGNSLGFDVKLKRLKTGNAMYLLTKR